MPGRLSLQHQGLAGSLLQRCGHALSIGQTNKSGFQPCVAGAPAICRDYVGIWPDPIPTTSEADRGFDFQLSGLNYDDLFASLMLDPLSSIIRCSSSHSPHVLTATPMRAHVIAEARSTHHPATRQRWFASIAQLRDSAPPNSSFGSQPPTIRNPIAVASFRVAGGVRTAVSTGAGARVSSIQ